MYTSVHLIPRDAPQWVPDDDFIRCIADHLVVSKVWTATTYATPLYSDSDEDNEKELSRAKNTSVDSAMQEFHNNKEALCLRMCLICKEWSTRLWKTLIDMAKERTHGNFVPCSVSIWIGPSSICDSMREKTVAHSNFQLKLSADGMPKNWDEYLNALAANEQIRDLLKVMKEKSGKNWDMLMSSSY